MGYRKNNVKSSTRPYGPADLGSMGHLMGSHHGGVSYRWAQKQLDRIFPDLGPVMFDEAWNGQIAPAIRQCKQKLFFRKFSWKDKSPSWEILKSYEILNPVGCPFLMGRAWHLACLA